MSVSELEVQVRRGVIEVTVFDGTHVGQINLSRFLSTSSETGRRPFLLLYSMFNTQTDINTGGRYV